MEQAITVTDSEIYIAGHLFVHKDFSITNKELIFDTLAQHWVSHNIRVYFYDGENLGFSNFVTFMEYVCRCFAIPHNLVTIESHDPTTSPFIHKTMEPGIFISTGQHLPNAIDHQFDNAKFVGSLLGRFNPTRFRLAYEIDNAFPADNFTVFQPQPAQIQQQYRHVSDLYKKELDWLATKQFEVDMQSTHHHGMIDWPDSCQRYPMVCNNYQIEIISETDAFSDFWFTEKTARCLALGKPFALVAGPGSLARLQDMGFKTFASVINEDYDRAMSPTRRIYQLISSLRVVYNSSNKSELIQQLYRIAAENIEIYKKYTAPPTYD